MLYEEECDCEMMREGNKERVREREESKERERKKGRKRGRERERERVREREIEREESRERRKEEMWKETVEKYYFVSTDKISYMHIYTLWDTLHLSGSSLMKSNASVARTYRYLYCSIWHEHLFSNKESDEKIIIILFFIIPLRPY